MERMSKMTEHYRDKALRDGWVAAPAAEVASLVRGGILERTSGAGRGMGNTPCWSLTEAAAAEAAAAAGTGRKVRALGRVLEVLEELPDGRLVVLRGSERVTVPASITRPV